MSDPSTRLLIAALAKISKPGAWTQGAFARYPNRKPAWPDHLAATCWCIFGVIQAVGYNLATAAQAVARLNTWTQANHGCDVAVFNDHPCRTQAEVVAMFEAVIAAGPLPHQMENQA